MTTMTINNHLVPITDRVHDTFVAFDSYLSLPSETKFRIDPKAHTYTELEEDFYFAVVEAFDMYLGDYILNNDDITFDEAELEYDAHEVIDIDDLLAQLETTFLENV